jgi:lipid A 4'-phosphatase
MNTTAASEAGILTEPMETDTKRSENKRKSADNPVRRYNRRPWNIIISFFYPLAILLPLTLLFRFTDLDITLANLFFEPGAGWEYQNENPWIFLYNYGVMPAWLLTISACCVFALSFFSTTIRSYRKKSLFIILLLIMGPGLVVNVIFKDHWGRPRPRDVDLFSGTQPFHSVWEQGTAGHGRSFPSGHASMGFFLFSPFFVLYRTSKKQAVSFLALGLGYGSLMGLCRMIQGGHFASDVIWSAGFVYLCGLGLYYLLGLDQEIR